MTTDNGNGLFDEETIDGEFKEYRRLILFELKRLNAVVKELDRQQRRTIGEILVLKVKAGVWGLIGSAIPIAIFLGIYVLKYKFGQ